MISTHRTRPETGAVNARVPAPRPGEDAADAESLLAALAELPEDSASAAQLRERLVDIFTPWARREARRYRNRGVDEDDLHQLAMLGLLKAIRGFDPHKGSRFLSYLLPTVSGEIKRYFRDCMWAVRAPRSQQDRRAEYNRFAMAFAQAHGRHPTQAEVGAHLGLDDHQAGEMITACSAYTALSLEAPHGGDGDQPESATLGDMMGEPDRDIERAVDRQALTTELRRLPERERRIVILRFFGNKTQSEIADVMGCSQMHVSRLLAGALAQMRRRLEQ